MGPNPVRDGVIDAWGDRDGEVVRIDDAALEAVAADVSEESLSLPDWGTAALPSSGSTTPETVVELLLVANTLNFQFDHYDTGATFQTTYADEEWTGAFGLFACFTRALAAGTPVTSGEYLASLDRGDVAALLDGDPAMPMLASRHRILRHVGERLEVLDADRLWDALPGSGPRPAFGEHGVVPWLVETFPGAYNDVRLQGGRVVPFLKKAQLGAALLAGRFGPTSRYGVTGLGELTLFADYVIPAVFRSLDVLEYDPALADRVDAGRVVPEGSAAEFGVRAGTVVAGDDLLARVNDRRTDPVTAVHLDQYLWRQGRTEDLAFHRTPTTSY